MKIGFFVFTDFQLLDLSGPLAAFEIAARYHGAAAYELFTVSLGGGRVRSSCGVFLETEDLEDHTFDTLFVVGSDLIEGICEDEPITHALREKAPSTRRMASICTGALLLASTGLLDGRKVTTHWRFAGTLAKKRPQLHLEPDRIYIQDGRFWTSAGITAGIDLSLALIQDDFGEAVSRKVAQDLVVFQRRPGGQSQYSALLEIDSQSEKIGVVLCYIRENLSEPLSVEDLAERAKLSPRQFARIFKSETGQTPAKAVETLRAEAARIRVENNFSESFEEIARVTGFNDIERMRRAFLRVFGQSPQALRRMAS